LLPNQFDHQLHSHEVESKEGWLRTYLLSSQALPSASRGNPPVEYQSFHHSHAAIPKMATAANGSMKAFIISGVMLTFSGFFDTFCGCVNWRRKAAVNVVGPFIAFGADHILHENSRIHHWHWQFESKPFVAA
jgi:hypothetical protein